MKRTRVCSLLGIDLPILQAGLPWVSNPELVAAVSNAGGLGILHPNAGTDTDEDLVENLQVNIRRVQRLTRNPFGVALYLPNPLVTDMIEAASQQGVHIAITYGGSPALYTGILKDHDITVLHQVTTVRHARGAEAQGVDIVIAEGFEGGGLRGGRQSFHNGPGAPSGGFGSDTRRSFRRDSGFPRIFGRYGLGRRGRADGVPLRGHP
jgi:enoyl-[acyl-carrier protein] reductase II